jgi:predicted RNA binding protein YcfA (HicA-like mRNA interferase family)
MPKLRRLSGNDLLRILSRFGFHPISQRGSHVKVRRSLPSGTHQTLTVVLHDELDKARRARSTGKLCALSRNRICSHTSIPNECHCRLANRDLRPLCPVNNVPTNQR